MKPIGPDRITRPSRRKVLQLIPALGIALAPAGALPAESAAAVINRDVNTALRVLQRESPTARELMQKAVAVLVFPNIVKGGLVVGGQYGEGALRVNGKTVGYYNIAAASFGLQAGGEAFSYALLFMNQGSLDYLRRSHGWAVGTGPTIVVIDQGAAASMTSATVTQDVAAIPFDARGLMAGVNIEGSKITRITVSK